MTEAEKIHAKLLSMLDGEPWMIADYLGKYDSTVIVNPERKMWTRIRGGELIKTMRPFKLDRNADWTVIRPSAELPPKVGSLNACRTDEGLAKLADYMRFGNEGDLWLKKRAAEREAEADAAFRRLYQTRPHELVTGYTIDECRSGIQHSHPDKGGDPHLFELWKARLEYAKSQEASNQPWVATSREK